MMAGQDQRRPLREPRISVQTICLVILTTIVVLATLRQAQMFAVPTVLAALVALALSPMAQRLNRLGLPNAITSFVLVASAAALLAAALYVLLPRAELLVAQSPWMAWRLEKMVRQVQTEVTETVGGGEVSDPADLLSTNGSEFLNDALSNAPAFIGAVVYFAFLSFFLLSERQSVWRVFAAIPPRFVDRLAAGRAMRAIRRNVGNYLLAITAINCGLGLVTAGVFLLLDVPNAVVWGAAMALLNYMPYLGPLVMNLLVLAVGLVTHGDIEQAAIPVLVLITLNVIEGYLITPTIVGRQARVSPLTVFFAVAFGAWLWGAAGALIATPTLIVLRALYDHLPWRERPTRASRLRTEDRRPLVSARRGFRTSG